MDTYKDGQEFQKMLLSSRNLKRNISKIIELIELMQIRNETIDDYDIDNLQIASSILAISNDLNLLVKEIKTQFQTNSILPYLSLFEQDIFTVERIKNCLRMLFSEEIDSKEEKIIYSNFFIENSDDVINEELRKINIQKLNKCSFEQAYSTLINEDQAVNDFCKHFELKNKENELHIKELKELFIDKEKESTLDGANFSQNINLLNRYSTHQALNLNTNRLSTERLELNTTLKKLFNKD